MRKEVSEINWDEIMNKFSTYDGVITNFCKGNNTKPCQLFYQRKKLQRETKPTFQAIELKAKESNKPLITNDYHTKAKGIKIELGKANIYIPAIRYN